MPNHEAYITMDSIVENPQDPRKEPTDGHVPSHTNIGSILRKNKPLIA